ncbi:MAG: DNA polymerase III subunit epsilon [Succinivibrionaceae bacterium]
MSDIYEQKCERQVVLDTETTGKSDDGSPGDHRIIEIGCVEVINRKITGNKLQIYINPERKVDEEAYNVHHISDEFLASQPKFHEISKKFIDFIKGSELLIHNAKFDVGFINHEFNLNKLNIKVEDICQVTDTLDIARKKYPGQKISLDALCSKLNVDSSARTSHGALLDSEILAEVYLAMTGGQEDFGFSEYDSNTSISANKTFDRESIIGNKKLKIIELDPTEEFEHVMYMFKLGQGKGIANLAFGDEYILNKEKGEISDAQKFVEIRTHFMIPEHYEKFQENREDEILNSIESK